VLTRRSFVAMLAAVSSGFGSSRAAVPARTAVLTRSYNNARTGANLTETTLNVANVGTRGIRQLFSLNMPGDARGSEAQTLIVPDVRTPDGQVHDIAIQASMSDAVFAFDANTGAVLWMKSLGSPINDNGDFDAWKINDHWGILSTPVIDAETGIVYACAWNSPDGTINGAKFIVHALRIADGSEVAAPVDLSDASYDPGHGVKPIAFGSTPKKQRCGVVLTTAPDASARPVKVLLVTFASALESDSNSHGWVVALTVNPLGYACAWCSTPHYSGAGIWMGSQAPAADDQGNIYLMTGNGAFDGVTDFGESFVKLRFTPAAANSPASLQAVDWWAPYTDAGRAGQNPAQPTIQMTMTAGAAPQPSNAMLVMPMTPETNRRMLQSAMTDDAAWRDEDLGSAGCLLAPPLNLLLGGGKDGILYVLNSADLGRTQLQDFASPAGINANYAKLKTPPIWFTFFPGWGVDAAPTDFTTLDVSFFGRTHHMHSTPVFYQSAKHGPMLFCGGENGPVRTWALDADGKATFLADSDEYASPNSPVPPGGMPGAMLSLSANGSEPGTALLIACFPYGDANTSVTTGFFVVYDAESFATRPDGSFRLNALWKSSDWGISYDHCKFNVPVVCNGKIYVPSYDGRVLVFGLA
jgi:hypothetical protein